MFVELQGHVSAVPDLRQGYDCIIGGNTPAAKSATPLPLSTRLRSAFQEVYTEDFFEKADGLIRQAAGQVSDSPEIFRKRVEFVRSGLELTHLMIKNIPLMKRVRESGGKDKKAVKMVAKNWKNIEKISSDAGPVAIAYESLLSKMQGSGYQGNMEDYFGPPAEKFLNPGSTKENKKKDTEPDDID